MTELIRDTVFGHFLRFVSHGQILPYAEDKDPNLWKRYVHEEKSERMARHGHVGEQAEGEGDTRQADQAASQETSRTRVGKDVQTNALGHEVDEEKGKNVNVVHWYSDNDPEV